MSNADTQTQAPRRSGLIVGSGLALALAGAGFYAAYSGMLPIGTLTGSPERAIGSGSHHEEASFVQIEPLLVTVNRSQPARQLRFEGHLEVAQGQVDSVTRMMPRILDVMNSYLRAIEMEDLRDPAALMRIRAQMLRRIQVVTGDGRVRDLLVTTFLIS